MTRLPQLMIMMMMSFRHERKEEKKGTGEGDIGKKKREEGKMETIIIFFLTSRQKIINPCCDWLESESCPLCFLYVHWLPSPTP